MRRREWHGGGIGRWGTWGPGPALTNKRHPIQMSPRDAGGTAAQGPQVAVPGRHDVTCYSPSPHPFHLGRHFAWTTPALNNILHLVFFHALIPLPQSCSIATFALTVGRLCFRCLVRWLRSVFCTAFCTDLPVKIAIDGRTRGCIFHSEGSHPYWPTPHEQTNKAIRHSSGLRYM